MDLIWIEFNGVASLRGLLAHRWRVGGIGGANIFGSLLLRTLVRNWRSTWRNVNKRWRKCATCATLSTPLIEFDLDGFDLDLNEISIKSTTLTLLCTWGRLLPEQIFFGGAVYYECIVKIFFRGELSPLPPTSYASGTGG